MLQPAMTSATPQLARAAVKAAIPLKPILKSSSTLLGTRRTSDDAGLDDDTMDSPQSPRKRQRVEFDLNNIEIHEIGARSVEEIKQEIKKALERHDQGDDEDYDLLKDTLSGKQTSSYDDDEDDDVDPTLPAKRRQELKVYLVSLASFSPRLGRSCDGIVKSVLQCQWLGQDEQFAKIYVQFLAALVSAQGARLTQVLSSIIERFTDSRPSDWAIPNYPTVSRDVAMERLHVAIRYLLQLFPSTKPVLEHLISSKYPFHDESKRMHIAYVDNLLKLRSYCPDLRAEIMDLVVSRLVQIDVEMQMNLDDMDDRLAAMVAMALKSSRENGNQDEEDSDESDAESVDSDESEENEYTRVKTAKENIEKMDSILDTLFELYTPNFADPDSDEASEVFEDLLSEFSNIILPTIKSRHTQFLIFHFGQKSERLIDAFCGTCINIAFESQRPLILQQAASAYLASFVARGVHVPGHIVVKIFEVLGYHLDQMRAVYETSCRGPDVRRYAPFYALMQALIYIYCFRWQDLIKSVPDEVDKDDPSTYLDQEIEWEPEIKDIMRRNIYSKLNPLKVCSPVIVEQFAKLAHRFRFMYVYPLIESNKRVRLSQFASGAYSSGGALRDMSFDMNDESWQQLGSFFPFDPYQLPVSKRWVEQDYIPWRTIPGLNQDERDEDSDDEQEEGDDDVEEDTATDDEIGEDE
ncbi:RNA polymerase I-specific transcription initiation factor RRN3 [Annulohypoxylon maeteangense]|uniref:RNA polymerase I-specific transcription initiation factor RRN3 n=1 Tax=Annulohypoxylon maeteangense TaxID=1927788 RepID=UPI002007972B|nr:RNA polymerase I-specific transcription initiation factor RRN3 [Annulohypoxylon maeteangense]KAI0890412.1 RNA polymerase I-specific transcription initiation factor RRN3 [Annulohypoxylon maeteangense]